jgi:SAM-dependent methyltransferase
MDQLTLTISAAVTAACVLALLPYILFPGKDAPFVPLEPDAVAKALALAEVGPGDVFYDLGSGDGRLLVAAARRGARAVGIELSLVRAWHSRALILLSGRASGITVRREDLFKADISEATVVHIYLLAQTHERIKDKLLKELPAGARIIATGFPLPGLAPAGEIPDCMKYGSIRLYLAG